MLSCSSLQLAHAIRLLLEYTNTPYEDKKYCASGEGKVSWVEITPRAALACGV